MRWLVLVFVGFMVAGPARAEEQLSNERWPDGPCRDVQQLEAVVVKMHKETFGASSKTTPAKAFLGAYRRNLLILLGLHCGVNIQAKMAKDQAAMNADVARTETDAAVSQPRGRPTLPNVLPLPDLGLDNLTIDPPQTPQRTLNCVTLKLSSDLSTTNCN